MNVKEVLGWGIKNLKEHKVSEPGKSADFLLRQVLGWGKAELYAHPEKILTPRQEKEFREYIEKRSEHQPVWYITGNIEFYGLTFSVNENVLIPRPETEFLVEKVIDKAKVKSKNEKNNLRILDIGTGSGAIILAIADHFKFQISRPNDLQVGQANFKFFASDISPEALIVANLNAKTLGLERDVDFRVGNLLEPWNGEKFDIIVANLPYIPHEEMASLAFDIHHWEPRVALDGGIKGLEIYKKALGEVDQYLNNDGWIFWEIGAGQGKGIKKIASEKVNNYQIEIWQDYGGNDRLAIFHKS